jgi:hypothetical protein
MEANGTLFSQDTNPPPSRSFWRDGFSAQRAKAAGRFLLAFCYHRAMKISAAVAMWMCVAFGLVCLGFAYQGFAALQTLTDTGERELSLCYAWFWTFLFAVAAVFGVLSWMIKAGRIRSGD